MPTHTSDASHTRSLPTTVSSPPATAVPKMIDRNVSIRKMPLARGRSAGRIDSGRMPYFDGPKNATLHAHQKQHHQHAAEADRAVEQKADHAQQHGGDLGHLRRR